MGDLGDDVSRELAVLREENARLREALTVSEQRLGVMVESLPFECWIVDAGGRYVMQNSTSIRNWGYHIGKRPDETGVSDSLWQVWVASNERALAGEVVRTEVEYDLNGERRHSIKVVVPIWNDGQVSSAFGISMDISDRKRLEAQLLQSQKMESVGRLAGGVAHDFNNLLTAMLGYADMAVLKTPSTSPAWKYLQGIRQSAQRGSALTQQLLAFARKQVVAPKTIDVNQLIMRIERMLHRLIGEDIELATVLAPGIGSTRVDPGQLEQVLMNMAVNARDAMPEGGQLTIETANVSLDRVYASQHVDVLPGDYIMIAVSDTGCGMPESVLKHLFEPFFTTKEQGKGTGLGLAMCYGIVKQSGGHIWVYSEESRGATFKIFLPRVDAPAEPQVFPEDPPAPPSCNEVVMVVEDEDLVRDIAVESLAAQGYTVIHARNGEEALEVARAHPGHIDLLVTDVVMPRMSGRELAQTIKPERPEMFVLFVSGYTENAVLHHGVLDHGIDFLQKPFTPSHLARKVREILDRRGRR